VQQGLQPETVAARQASRTGPLRTPHVRLYTVGLAVAHLRWQIARRSYHSLGLRSSMVKDLGNTKVAQLHQASSRHEYILALEVAVENMPAVDMAQGKAALGEDHKCFKFRKVTTFCLLLANCTSKITLIGRLHDNVEFGCLYER